MAHANSSRTSRAKKDFPLWLHKPSGNWCRTILGTRHYFGRDREAALRVWLEQKDDLLAGRKPRPKNEIGLTIRQLCNAYLTAKESALTSGDFAERSFQEVRKCCERMVKQLGGNRPVDDLRPDDFVELRATLSENWRPQTLKSEIVRVKGVFKWGYDNDLLALPVKFGTGFSIPKQKTLRLDRHKHVGEKLLTADQILTILSAAKSPQVKAMILLGVNCGLGNSDCAFVRTSDVNLDSGWLVYPRNKTGVMRKAKLWGETVAAIRTVLANPRTPKNAEWKDLVFLTKYGGPYSTKHTSDSAVGREFWRLLTAHGMHRPGIGFYTLRHVFRTVADETGDQVACDVVMGHSRNDMASRYRERISDERLERVAKHVHAWLFGSKRGAK